MTASQVTRQPAQYTQTGSMDCTSIEETHLLIRLNLLAQPPLSHAGLDDCTSLTATARHFALARNSCGSHLARLQMLLELFNAGMPQIPFVGFAKVCNKALLQPTDRRCAVRKYSSPEETPQRPTKSRSARSTPMAASMLTIQLRSECSDQKAPTCSIHNKGCSDKVHRPDTLTGRRNRRSKSLFKAAVSA